MTDIDNLSFKVLLEHAHIGVIIHGWDTSIIYINPTGLELLRLTYDQAIGRDAFDPHWTFIDETGNILLLEDYPVNRVKRNKERIVNEVIGVIDSTKDDISWFLINAYYEGYDSEKRFIVVTLTDISESKQLFSFQDVVENTQDMVVITDAKNIKHPDGPKIVYVNKAFEELTGYSSSDVIGETPRILQGALTDGGGKSRISSALEAKKEVTETLLNYDSKGRPYWVEMNIIPLRNKFYEITHFAAIQRNVSESKFQTEQLRKRNSDLKDLKNNLEEIVKERTLELQKAKSQLEKIAFFDPLTNIPNRRFFTNQVYKLVKSCIRHGGMVAFGIFDVDNFKSLNDTYGHSVGDMVLVELGRLLISTLRVDDVYCRFGGEEFAFALILKEMSGVESVSDKILNAVRSVEVLLDNGEIIAITVSMGINVTHPNEGTDIDHEIKKADLAMYEAKNTGKDRCNITLG
jgi:diguanylate cyclase (GGDEF)-like protein/PAS domain S-box-containing protein